MKASELIKELQAQIAKGGDRNVAIPSCNGRLGNVMAAEGAHGYPGGDLMTRIELVPHDHPALDAILRKEKP